jgi:hypothetical protein
MEVQETSQHKYTITIESLSQYKTSHHTSNASTTVTPKEGSLGIPFEAVVGSTAGAAGANFSVPLLFHDKI